MRTTDVIRNYIFEDREQDEYSSLVCRVEDDLLVSIKGGAILMKRLEANHFLVLPRRYLLNKPEIVAYATIKALQTVYDVIEGHHRLQPHKEPTYRFIHCPKCDITWAEADIQNTVRILLGLHPPIQNAADEKLSVFLANALYLQREHDISFASMFKELAIYSLDNKKLIPFLRSNHLIKDQEGLDIGITTGLMLA